MYILAGKQKLEEKCGTTVLPDAVERAKACGLLEDAQVASDMDDMCKSV